MAGLLYLPRLFIYHLKSPVDSIQCATFKVMERKLSNTIMLPAMILTYFSGIMMLILQPNLITDISIIIKLILVLLLSAVHGKFSKIRKNFEDNKRVYQDFQLKVWNEVPTCIMILIVILVVFRPF